jgi:dinuclear metal center YbgI/SA1388 family protein
MKLQELDEYLENLLRIREIKDISLNGIQVGDEHQEIQNIGLAVDASLPVIEKALTLDIDLLLVHHGIFWGKSFAIKGADYRKIKSLIEKPMALYAVHLPLDMHAPLGNNMQLAYKLDLEEITPFGDYGGAEIGCRGYFNGSTDELIQKCNELSSGVRVILHHPSRIRKIGIVSGKGGSDILNQYLRSDLDLLITGEIEHSIFNTIRDWEGNVIALGHYESEKFGVQALGEHLEKELNLVTSFISEPTGF